MKKNQYLMIILSVLVLMMQAAPVYAQDNETTDGYEFIEDSESCNDLDGKLIPDGSYITANPICSIEKINSTTIRVHVKCNFGRLVEKASITIQLQKLSGTSWITVKSITDSESKVSSIDKNWTISGLSPGTYRVKVAVVTILNGSSESFTSQSGNITLP